MIFGTGTDIVEIERIRALVASGGERFLGHWFSEREIAYCQSKANPHLHLSSRMAAKEAAFKALRLSGVAPLCWKDIAIDVDDGGSPLLVLSGEPLAAANRLGVTRLHVSLAHGGAYAIATVIAECAGY